MPLQKGSSEKTISKNIGELESTKPSAGRAKGIATLAKNRGITPAKAKAVQAEAIAFSKSKRSTSDGYMKK
jgi:hypothetical protein